MCKIDEIYCSLQNVHLVIQHISVHIHSCYWLFLYQAICLTHKLVYHIVHCMIDDLHTTSL